MSQLSFKDTHGNFLLLTWKSLSKKPFAPSVKAFVVLSGQQPPSSMAPTVLKSNSKMLVIGSTGGNMITAGMVSVSVPGQ